MDQSVIFQALKVWHLEAENEVNLKIKDYNPWVNDWIGVFNVCITLVYFCKFYYS